MSERIPCCIPGCRRTFKDEGKYTEYMCGKHWRLGPKTLRALRTAALRRRRYRLASMIYFRVKARVLDEIQMGFAR